jgi:hypothetical protein
MVGRLEDSPYGEWQLTIALLFCNVIAPPGHGRSGGGDRVLTKKPVAAGGIFAPWSLDRDDKRPD